MNASLAILEIRIKCIFGEKYNLGVQNGGVKITKNNGSCSVTSIMTKKELDNYLDGAEEMSCLIRKSEAAA